VRLAAADTWKVSQALLFVLFGWRPCVVGVPI
jgi:hypothetical protein